MGGPVAVDPAKVRDTPLDDPDGPMPDGTVLKLHGTNMAIRRERPRTRWVASIPRSSASFSTTPDLALRLAEAGHAATWLPSAQVHHAFAASARRTADRGAVEPP